MTKKDIKSIKNLLKKYHRNVLLGNKEGKAFKTYVHEEA
jgi:hypothetical protein